jgi:hypothetical protein
VGFCDGQKWRWGRFSPRTSVSLANLHSICFSTIIFTITRGWHNRPGVAAVPTASQTRIKKNTINYKNSRSIFNRTLLPWLPRTRPTLALILRLSKLNYTDSYILSAMTTHRKHSSSTVTCVSVGVPTWLIPSQSIGELAAAYQQSRREYIENTAPVFLAACLFQSVSLAKGFSGSTI